MKLLFLIIFPILILFNLHSDELKWVDEQIEAIKPPREGIADANVTLLKDPFIFLNKKNEESSVEATSMNPSTSKSSGTRQKSYSGLIVKAILNKSAMINGKWYKINDKISSYTITEIDRTSVTLKNKAKTVVLSTASKNSNLKFNNK